MQNSTIPEDINPRAQGFLDIFLNSSQRFNLLEQAVQSARNGIVITDPRLPDNPIIYANLAFTEMTGYSLHEILGKNCRFLQGADREQAEIQLIKKAIADGEAIMVTLRNYRKDGTLFWNELSLAPVRDASGELVNFVGVQNDVSARKEAEKRVSEFYSMVSHELRTPLSSIRASLGLISDGSAGEIPPSAARLNEIALQSTNRLLRLVDDILDLKKMEAGKLDLELSMVEPSKIVHEAIEAVQPLCVEGGIKLESRLNSRRTICADPTRILQVLINLLANAIKFSSGATLVTIETMDVKHAVRFVVRDRGVGIAAADIEKLFVKFHQLDASDTRAQTGSGLGLAISRTIVEMHGGKIGVESKPGQGSDFWFELPLVPAK